MKSDTGVEKSVRKRGFASRMLNKAIDERKQRTTLQFGKITLNLASVSTSEDNNAVGSEGKQTVSSGEK